MTIARIRYCYVRHITYSNVRARCGKFPTLLFVNNISRTYSSRMRQRILDTEASPPAQLKKCWAWMAKGIFFWRRALLPLRQCSNILVSRFLHTTRGYGTTGSCCWRGSCAILPSNVDSDAMLVVHLGVIVRIQGVQLPNTYPFGSSRKWPDGATKVAWCATSVNLILVGRASLLRESIPLFAAHLFCSNTKSPGSIWQKIFARLECVGLPILRRGTIHQRTVQAAYYWDLLGPRVATFTWNYCLYTWASGLMQTCISYVVEDMLW